MRYETPATIEAAVGLIAAETGIARVLSGGTDLLVQLKAGMIEPDLVVDLKRIAATREITAEAGGFRIGSAVSAASLREHKALRAAWPGIIEGLKLIGSTQVQGRATLTGNLCNASPAADSVPCLVAAGASARIVGPSGKRDIPVQDVPAGPGRTNLAKGELVESLFIPAAAAHTGSCYLRFTPRTEMDIAVVSAGVSVTLDASGTCTAACIVLGAVAARVTIAEEAAKAIIGTKVDEAALAKMQAAASAAATPIDDKRGTKEFRIEVAGVLARRAVEKALERARGK